MVDFIFYSLDLFPDSSNLCHVLKAVDFLNSVGLSCVGSFQESDSIHTFPNPRSTAGDSDGFTEWPAFSEEDQKVMVFDTVSSARSLPILDKLKIFDTSFAG